MLTHNTTWEIDIVLAFFDILGSANKLMNNQYKLVYDFYSYMINLCSAEDLPLSFGALPGMKLHNISEPYELVIRCPIKHAFFSDTFILWIEYDSIYGMRKGGFYEKCISIFIEALKNQIPLRGAISCGRAIMDDDRKIYLGHPLVESARLEAAQDWLGISIGLSCDKIYPSEARYILPYDEHYKKELKQNPNEETFTFEHSEQKAIIGWGGIDSPMVLDWPRYCRNNNFDPIQVISQMDTDEKFSHYYKNTIKFIEHSKMNYDYMKALEDEAPPLRTKMVRYIK